MQHDEAAHQDPRDTEPEHHHAAMELLRAYFGPMRWYVQEGRSPAGDVTETGHLPRPRFQAEDLEPADSALPLAAEAEC